MEGWDIINNFLTIVCVALSNSEFGIQWKGKDFFTQNEWLPFSYHRQFIFEENEGGGKKLYLINFGMAATSNNVAHILKLMRN